MRGGGESELWEGVGGISVHAQCQSNNDTYMAMERLRRKDNPLDWWRQHETHLPRLARLAKKYLSVPSTSVPSERVFSKAGQLVSARRAKLNPKNVDMILFLNKH